MVRRSQYLEALPEVLKSFLKAYLKSLAFRLRPQSCTVVFKQPAADSSSQILPDTANAPMRGSVEEFFEVARSIGP